MSYHIFSEIPQIEKITTDKRITPYIDILSRPIVIDIIRKQVQQFRRSLLSIPENRPDINLLYQQLEQTLAQEAQHCLQTTINATGIMIHTNLGRSPISPIVWKHAESAVCRYSNLELNLQEGKRGNRMGLLPKLIQHVCGAEASLLVNNNAAALYLLLSTFAQGKEVLVSRGEQVQIGGGFRIPDIVTQTGAILKDVGTTNITTINDYLNNITDNTAMVLIVHSSNYAIQGFTASPDLKALAAHLPDHILLVVDQGSGTQDEWLQGEKSVKYYLNAGADLVCFSTDKMLGATQGGIIAGQHILIEQMAKHPLMRVVRPGKVTYALLEKQLILRLNKQDPHQTRLSQLAEQPLTWHQQQAEYIIQQLNHHYKAVISTCFVGGGTNPCQSFPTYAIELPDWLSAQEWLEKLRNSTPAVIAVSKHNKALIYPISLLEEDVNDIVICLKTLEATCHKA